MVIAKVFGGGGNGKLLFNGHRVSVLQDGKVQEIGCTTCENT